MIRRGTESSLLCSGNNASLCFQFVLANYIRREKRLGSGAEVISKTLQFFLGGPSGFLH